MRRAAAVRSVGPVQWVLIPAAITLLATLVLATPVSLFGLRLPEPVIPLVLAFAWPMIRPSIIAPVLLTLIGLLIDIFWNMPLGLWTLALLAVYGLVLSVRSLLIGQDTAFRFGWYVVCCGLAFAIGYGVTVLLGDRPPSLYALAGQVAPTLLLFPFANGLIEKFEDGDVRFR